MIPLIANHCAAIAALCGRYHVRRLELFGSAARGDDFDPNRSDLDFLVDYDPAHSPKFEEFLELREALATLLGRRVDLVMTGSIRNPFINASIERSRELVFAA